MSSNGPRQLDWKPAGTGHRFGRGRKRDAISDAKADKLAAQRAEFFKNEAAKRLIGPLDKAVTRKSAATNSATRRAKKVPITLPKLKCLEREE